MAMLRSLTLARTLKLLRVVTITALAGVLPLLTYACSSDSNTSEDGGVVVEGCEASDCTADCLQACQKIESNRCLPLYTDCQKTCSATSPNARKAFAECAATASSIDCAESECYYGIPGAPRIAPARLYDVCVLNCTKISTSGEGGLACVDVEKALGCSQACKNGTLDKINGFNKCMSTWQDRCVVGKPCYETFVAK